MTTPNFALLTVSDSRTIDNDTSGDYLTEAVKAESYEILDRVVLKDDVYKIRARVSEWIADEKISVVIVSGGTGITGRDNTPTSIRPLLDLEIEGFGELFRTISYEEIGTSTMLSRAFMGIANSTFIFCLPGSPSACRTAWEKIIRPQLNKDTRPCNLTSLLPRVSEE